MHIDYHSANCFFYFFTSMLVVRIRSIPSLNYGSPFYIFNSFCVRLVYFAENKILLDANAIFQWNWFTQQRRKLFPNVTEKASGCTCVNLAKRFRYRRAGSFVTRSLHLERLHPIGKCAVMFPFVGICDVHFSLLHFYRSRINSSRKNARQQPP